MIVFKHLLSYLFMRISSKSWDYFDINLQQKLKQTHFSSFQSSLLSLKAQKVAKNPKLKRTFGNSQAQSPPCLNLYHPTQNRLGLTSAEYLIKNQPKTKIHGLLRSRQSLKKLCEQRKNKPIDFQSFTSECSARFSVVMIFISLDAEWA